MKTLKGWLTSGALAAMLLLGSSVAKADTGIIFGFAGSDSGSDTTTCSDSEGIIFGATGIIFGGIIFGAADTPADGCS